MGSTPIGNNPSSADLTANVKNAGDEYEHTMSGIITTANAVGGDAGAASSSSELGNMLSLSFKQAAAEIKKDAKVGANQSLSNARKQQAQKTEQQLGQ